MKESLKLEALPQLLEPFCTMGAHKSHDPTNGKGLVNTRATAQDDLVMAVSHDDPFQ